METALVVLVPEAEAVVGRWRLAHDPSAAEGVPAHVTLLYPFVPFARLDEAVEAALSGLFAGFAPFALTFSTVGRFPHVVWLAPDDPAPLVALSQALIDAFPDYPPYGGAHEGITPHLTVAQVKDGPDFEAEIERIETAFLTDAARRLPVRAPVHEAWLLAQKEDGRWRKVRAFALG